MQALFSPDSKFMQAMSRLFDLVLLNFLFLLTCLPIFTIGAAATALYTCCFQISQERGILKSYFRAFRESFRQSTLLWLILLLCGGSALFNLMLFRNMGGVMGFLAIPFGILLALAVLTGSCAFPLTSRFSNDLKTTIKNALLLSLGYLPRFALLAFLNVFPLIVFFTDIYVFFQTGFIWITIYFSFSAYVGTLLLKKVFAPYLPPEECETE